MSRPHNIWSRARKWEMSIFRLSVFLLLVSARRMTGVPFSEPGSGQLALVPAQGAASAQDSNFDVISIRPSDPNQPGFSVRPDINNFYVRGAPLKFLVQYAYGLHDFQIEGGPAWVNSARFDIIAKKDVPPDLVKPSTGDWESEQKLLELRLQDLLATRFNLRVHKVIEQRAAFGLVVGKNGPKLKAGVTNTGYMVNSGEIRCSYSTMNNLAEILSDMTELTVVDQTHLTGAYAFSLKWTKEDVQGVDNAPPGLFTAITEQLGLKLVNTKGPVTILVIDRADKPSDN